MTDLLDISIMLFVAAGAFYVGRSLGRAEQVHYLWHRTRLREKEGIHTVGDAMIEGQNPYVLQRPAPLTGEYTLDDPVYPN